MDDNFKRKNRIRKLSGFWSDTKQKWDDYWSREKRVNRRMNPNPGEAAESELGGRGGRIQFRDPADIRRERLEHNRFYGPGPSADFKKDRDKIRQQEHFIEYEKTPEDSTGLGEDFSRLVDEYKGRFNAPGPENVNIKNYYRDILSFLGDTLGSDLNVAYEGITNVWAMLTAKKDDDIFMDLVRQEFDEKGIRDQFSMHLQRAMTAIMQNYKNIAVLQGMSYGDVVGLFKRKHARAMQSWNS